MTAVRALAQPPHTLSLASAFAVVALRAAVGDLTVTVAAFTVTQLALARTRPDGRAARPQQALAHPLPLPLWLPPALRRSAAGAAAH